MRVEECEVMDLIPHRTQLAVAVPELGERDFQRRDEVLLATGREMLLHVLLSEPAKPIDGIPLMVRGRRTGGKEVTAQGCCRPQWLSRPYLDQRAPRVGKLVYLRHHLFFAVRSRIGYLHVYLSVKWVLWTRLIKA